MLICATALSQKVTLSVRKQPLHEVLNEVAAQTGASMIYNMEQLRSAAPVTVNLKQASLEQALKAIFKSQSFSYDIRNGTVIIRPNNPPNAVIAVPAAIVPADEFMDVIVRAIDERGRPVPNVTVSIRSRQEYLVTDENGVATLKRVRPNTIVTFTSVGFEEQSQPVSNNTVELVVRMVHKISQLNTLEISTGISSRKQESFTGSASVFTGQQLKSVGNKNVLESLKSLDPAFVQVTNNLAGSNPNKLPNFEIRGRTSISTINLNDQFSSDPNQPLFILDGFETTLQAIYDLDMNRVATITILKDAASTALYGSKASNGVVVVETKRPKPGRLQLNYTSDLSLNIPDLSSYNLMNAAEKLQFEKLSGRYSQTGAQGWQNEAIYNAHLADVQRGVNTYWLSEPVRTAFSNRHSVQITGGNEDLMVNAGFVYGQTNGVMKGSNRDNWSSNINLTYRKGKVNISNLFTVNGSNSNESPYGSFADYAKTVPYYRKKNADGTINRYLDPLYDTTIINPLYNASLYSRNETALFAFQNNLQAIVTLSPSFRLQGALLLGKGNSTGILFIPPDHSAYVTLPANQKGRYTNTRNENSQYNGNLTLIYSKVAGPHQITGMVRGEVRQQTTSLVGFTAVGFPYGTDGSPEFAFGFLPYSTPQSSSLTSRSVGFLSSVNYVYDQRFMIDGVYRLDGSSVFGSDRVFKPFISGGVGWNIHHEEFMKDISWINLLKLRGNIGYTGNQNIGSFSSVSLYSYNAGNVNNFGQGLNLASLGNPGLDWQKTLQQSYGLDFMFWNNRISGSLEYYNKKTDPLAVGAAGTLPSSTGVNQNYVINLGNLTTKGYSVNLRVSPVNNTRERIIWTVGVMGSRNNSRYGGFASRLFELNKAEQTSKGLSRYYDGYSPDDMWAVRSRGIDPATGQEVFEKKDGTLTFNYDPNDVVRVGNTRPVVEGNMNTSFAWKDFTFSAVVSYQVGGYVFNNALFDKVENFSSLGTNQNLDRRALYDRWQKPGDKSAFTGINSVYSGMISSRFIQRDTHFTGESFSLNYRMKTEWVRKLRLQSLNMSLYMNDIFRIESILSERGIDYPYARTLSFSVNASF
jgi:TonB-linked SusC/RagA family outer membrane protein